MIKKIALGGLILLAICSILLVSQIKVATYLFDHKLDSALTRVEQKVPGVKLRFEPGDSSFTKRAGRVYYELPLKAGNSLGVSSISGAVDLEVFFGPLKVSGGLKSVPGVGNLDQIFSKFKVDPITFTGAFKATAVTPKLEASLRSESFMLPLEEGICKFGQNSVSFVATSQEDVDVAFNSAGVVCEGALRYNNKPNYRLDLLGLNVKFLPRIIDRKPHFESLVVDLQNLDFKFSTIYAIGFGPEEPVRDPSLQEAISFSDIYFALTLGEPDANGMYKMFFDNSGNYAFAFPYIQYDVEQPFYRFENFKLKGELDRVSIPRLYDATRNILENASETFDTKQAFGELMKGFTDTITLIIDQFGYSHEGKNFSISGQSEIAFDQTSARPRLSKLDSEYHIKADKLLVEELAAANYSEALEEAVAAGQINLIGDSYETTLRLQGTELSLNNIAVKAESSDEALYEEEQRAQQAQAAQERAEAEALQREIKAAQEAQENLPSFVEGSLNSDNAAQYSTD
ncbi:MAG TPA: hypothetical protein H9898_05150 [Candidatus Anaerobiospirillum stercoravium]|nr:hypothetical protein [Candidatus Anaerobiospirillum stercoravium]